VFLLDTDHVVIVQSRTQPEFSRLRARMDVHSPADIYVSIVSFHEEIVGWNSYSIARRTHRG
jgi:tRNA(fMet)-specific endonuclease VapC